MVWQDSSQLPHSNWVPEARPQQDVSGNIAFDLSTSATINNDDDSADDHHTLQLIPITWNAQLGIYEGQESIAEAVPEPGTWTLSIVMLTAVWSLCELPFELSTGQSNLKNAACIVAKLIWIALSHWTMSGSRMARSIFAFCCSVSVVSIASGLMIEEKTFVIGFCLSIVECATKAVAFILIVWPATRRVA